MRMMINNKNNKKLKRMQVIKKIIGRRILKVKREHLKKEVNSIKKSKHTKKRNNTIMMIINNMIQTNNMNINNNNNKITKTKN